MFKLVTLTALIATTNASAAADKAAVKKDEADLQAKAAKYNATPGAKVWKKHETEDKKTKKKVFSGYSFMAGTDDKLVYPLPKDAKIEDLKDNCQACFVTGNVFTKGAKEADNTCEPPKGAKHLVGKKEVDILATDLAEINYDLTYEEWVTGSLGCGQAVGCGADTFTKKAFEAGAPTGKKGDKSFQWSYDYADAVDTWDTCRYTAAMPTNKKGKVEWKGGLLLSHVVPKDMDIQAVVNVNVVGDKGYLYNSQTLELLAVGKTGKIVIPMADSIDVVYTSMVDLKAKSDFSVTFDRKTTAQLAEFTLEHGGVIVWVIIGIVVFCLLCVGVIVWKKCFHKNDDFYLEDSYARV